MNVALPFEAMFTVSLIAVNVRWHQGNFRVAMNFDTDHQVITTCHDHANLNRLNLLCFASSLCFTTQASAAGSPL